MPYSGQTGGHPSYGWKHDHKIDAFGPNFAKWVIANYAHRRIFYDNAPVRNSGYLMGGRPKDWVLQTPPEDPGDQPGGEAAYLTSKGIVLVSGPDISHAQFGPLFAICDSKILRATALGKLMGASVIARIIAMYHLNSLRGMIMKSSTQIIDYTFTERNTSTFLNALVMATKRGVIFAEDLEWMTKYLTERIIPYYQKPPPPNPGGKGGEALPPGTSFEQLYNGLYWTLPPFYDAWKACPEGLSIKKDLGEIVVRQSQYMLDLETLNPGNGFPSLVEHPQGILDGENGKPVSSWLPFLQPNQCHFDGTWSHWGMRAGFISAEVTGSRVMKDACALNLANWKAKAQQPGYKYAVDDKAWMVGADGEYL
jgi:hypothetical protein